MVVNWRSYGRTMSPLFDLVSVITDLVLALGERNWTYA
jgi:hypothetical protein